MAERFISFRRKRSHESESYAAVRREHIKRAIERLFAERPEYRSRRVGQITCRLPKYLPEGFPRGPSGASGADGVFVGLPKDAEVAAILDGVAA
jgi:hypothetical protein